MKCFSDNKGASNSISSLFGVLPGTLYKDVDI